MNLRSIAQTLQTYAVSNEAFPASQQELVDFAGYGSKLFHCPDPNGGEYIYIAGHRSDDSAPTVVVYESKPVHNGKCNVLLFRRPDRAADAGGAPASPRSGANSPPIASD